MAVSLDMPHVTRRSIQRVTRRRPCVVCNSPDWCGYDPRKGVAYCNRVPSSSGERYGGWGWIHLTTATPGEYDARLVAEGDTMAAALSQDTIDGRHLLYTETLDAQACKLATAELRDLKRRGLTEAQIARHGYRTFPDFQRAAGICNRLDLLADPRQSLVARQFNATHSSTLASELARLPGTYTQSNRSHTDINRYFAIQTASPGALAIPVKNVDGKVVAIRLRKRDADPKHRYTWLSHEKNKSGAHIHVARPEGTVVGRAVWITEGEIKANVAADALGEIVLSLPGITNQSQLPAVLDALAERGELTASTQLIIALDMEKDTKKLVYLKQAITKLAAYIVARGQPVYMATWDSTHKGLDDLLVAGGRYTLKPHRMQITRGVMRVETADPIPDAALLSLADAEYAIDVLARKLMPLNYVGQKASWEVIRAVVGLGKTGTFLSRLASLMAMQTWPQKKNGKAIRVLYLTDTIEQLEEKSAKYFGQRWRESLIQGGGNRHVWIPSRDYPNLWIMEGRSKAFDSSSYCANDAVNDIGARRHLAMMEVCTNRNNPCDFKDTCQYLSAKQRSKDASLVMACKAAYMNESKELDKFDIIIIDEDATGHMLDEYSVARADVDEWRRLLAERDDGGHYSYLGLGLQWWQSALAEAAANGKPAPALPFFHKTAPTGLIDDGGAPITPLDLLRAMVGACGGKTKKNTPHALCERPSDGVIPLRAIYDTGKALLAEWERSDAADTRLLVSDTGTLTARLPKDSLVKRLAGRRVIWLDATANTMIMRYMLAAVGRAESVPLNVHDIQVRQNIEVMQVTDSLFSRNALGKRDGLTSNLIDETVAALAEQRGVALNRVGVMTFKSFDPNEPDTETTNDDRFLTGHFGKDDKATDKFDHCEVFVTKGHYTPNIGQQIAVLQAWRFSPDEHSTATHHEARKYPNQPYAVMRPTADDVDIQTMIEHATWAHQAQAIGRLRAVRRAGESLLWVRFDKNPYSNLPVARLLTHDELRSSLGLSHTQVNTIKRVKALHSANDMRRQEALARATKAIDDMLDEGIEMEAITAYAVRRRAQCGQNVAEAAIVGRAKDNAIGSIGTADSIYIYDHHGRTYPTNETIPDVTLPQSTNENCSVAACDQPATVEYLTQWLCREHADILGVSNV